jgi:uncharacterized protein (TIGR02118 family)
MIITCRWLEIPGNWLIIGLREAYGANIMVKLTLLFRPPPDLNTFEEGYNHALALLEQMPNIRRRQACLVLGSPGGTAPYYRILEFYFADRAAMDEAMLSESGTAAGQALVGFAGRNVELIFAEVFEE